MEYKLPPLPELLYLGDDASYGYEAIDMTEYAEQAVAPLLAEIERLEKKLKRVKDYSGVQDQ